MAPGGPSESEMVRNVLLFIALAAIAAVAYFGLMNSLSSDDPEDGADELSNLPTSQSSAADDAMGFLGDTVKVQAGGEMELTRYDPKTGQARDRFRFANWQPLGRDSKEVSVSKPQLMLTLGGGLVATVVADEGQITVDRIEQQLQSSPKRGALRGNAKIHLDRARSLADADAAGPSSERITIELDELRFDLQVGTLAGDGRMRVRGPQFDVSGRGLFFEWNQADNVVKQLVLRRGEFIELNLAPRTETLPPAASQPVVSRSASQPVATNAPRKPDSKNRERTAYELVLHDNVRVDQMRGEMRVGGLTADEIRVLIDVGKDAKTLLTGEGPLGQTPASTPTSASATSVPQPLGSPPSAPASASAPADPMRLVIRWDGTLELLPRLDDAARGPLRRQFVATGKSVRLDQANGSVECGRVEYHDEDKQIWLSPGSDGLVRLTRGRDAYVAARTIYINQNSHLIKLIGDVELLASKSGGGGRGLAIRAEHFAEIRLAKGEGPASNQATRSPISPIGGPTDVDWTGVESARFVGAVDVLIDGDRLNSEQLDVRFRKAAAAGPGGVEASLDEAVASGSVRFRADDQSMRCERLTLKFDTTSSGQIFPRETAAAGDVVIQNGRSWARGRRINAYAVAEPPAAPNTPGEVAIRRLEIVDGARLADPDNKVAARGERVIANFSGRNELTDAVVVGRPGEPAEVRADNYRVRGAQVDLDPRAQTLSVNGKSWLAFDATRIGNSRARRRPTLVEIESNDALRVDVRSEKIEFSGDVIARSRDEELRSERLTLLLKSTPRQVVAARAMPYGSAQLAFASAIQRAWSGGASASSTAQPKSGIARLASAFADFRKLAGGAGRRAISKAPRLALAIAPVDREARREPVRIVADDALFRTESYVRAGRPLSIAEVKSPKLTFEIEQRQLLSEGMTLLGMTSRNLGGQVSRESAEDAIGLPSPLVSRGPSQTGLRCTKSMTYVIGKDSVGARRDLVVFDGEVYFFHRIGRDMLDIQKVLPELTAAQISQLPGRVTTLDCGRVECEFLANQDDPSDPRGSLKLAWMIASGNVALRDEQGPAVRTVQCDRLEFNREQSIINVNGSASNPAKIYSENKSTNQAEMPAVGESFTIDLNKNQIRTQGTRGEFRR